MFVLINGGDAVGTYLARTLARKGHAISVLESRPEVARAVAEDLSSLALVVEGDGCNVRHLAEAGADHADVFASVTDSDEVNLVACQLAKVHFGARRVVARVASPANERIFNALGIEAISSTTIIGRLVEEEVSVGDIIRLYTLQKGRLALVELEVPVAGQSGSGCRVADLSLPEGIVLVSVLRGDEVIVPRGATVLLAGDRLLAVTAAGSQEGLVKALQEGMSRGGDAMQVASAADCSGVEGPR